jgi:hypothetical protein
MNVESLNVESLIELLGKCNPKANVLFLYDNNQTYKDLGVRFVEHDIVDDTVYLHGHPPNYEQIKQEMRLNIVASQSCFAEITY